MSENVEPTVNNTDRNFCCTFQTCRVLELFRKFSVIILDYVSTCFIMVATKHQYYATILFSKNYWNFKKLKGQQHDHLKEYSKIFCFTVRFLRSQLKCAVDFSIVVR